MKCQESICGHIYQQMEFFGITRFFWSAMRTLIVFLLQEYMSKQRAEYVNWTMKIYKRYTIPDENQHYWKN